MLCGECTLSKLEYIIDYKIINNKYCGWQRLELLR